MQDTSAIKDDPLRHTCHKASILPALTALRLWFVAMLLGVAALALQTSAGPESRLDAGEHRALAGELAKGLMTSRQQALRPAAPPSQVPERHDTGMELAGPAEVLPADFAATASPLLPAEPRGERLLPRYSGSPRAPPLLHA